MNVRSVLLVPVLAVGAAMAQIPDQRSLKDTLVANSRAFMDSWRKGDMTALGATLTPDFMYVGLEGIVSRQQVLQDLPHCTLRSYEMRDVQLHSISATTASIVYRLHQEASCEGHPLPPEMLAVDTYVRQDGKWLLSLSSLTPAPAHDARH